MLTRRRALHQSADDRQKYEYMIKMHETALSEAEENGMTAQEREIRESHVDRYRKKLTAAGGGGSASSSSPGAAEDAAKTSGVEDPPIPHNLEQIVELGQKTAPDYVSKYEKSVAEEEARLRERASKVGGDRKLPPPMMLDPDSEGLLDSKSALLEDYSRPARDSSTAASLTSAGGDPTLMAATQVSERITKAVSDVDRAALDEAVFEERLAKASIDPEEWKQRGVTVDDLKRFLVPDLETPDGKIERYKHVFDIARDFEQKGIPRADLVELVRRYQNTVEAVRLLDEQPEDESVYGSMMAKVPKRPGAEKEEDARNPDEIDCSSPRAVLFGIGEKSRANPAQMLDEALDHHIKKMVEFEEWLFEWQDRETRRYRNWRDTTSLSDPLGWLNTANNFFMRMANKWEGTSQKEKKGVYDMLDDALEEYKLRHFKRRAHYIKKMEMFMFLYGELSYQTLRGKVPTLAMLMREFAGQAAHLVAGGKLRVRERSRAIESELTIKYIEALEKQVLGDGHNQFEPKLPEAVRAQYLIDHNLMDEPYPTPPKSPMDNLRQEVTSPRSTTQRLGAKLSYVKEYAKVYINNILPALRAAEAVMRDRTDYAGVLEDLREAWLDDYWDFFQPEIVQARAEVSYRLAHQMSTMQRMQVLIICMTAKTIDMEAEDPICEDPDIDQIFDLEEGVSKRYQAKSPLLLQTQMPQWFKREAVLAACLQLELQGFTFDELKMYCDEATEYEGRINAVEVGNRIAEKQMRVNLQLCYGHLAAIDNGTHAAMLKTRNFILFYFISAFPGRIGRAPVLLSTWP